VVAGLSICDSFYLDKNGILPSVRAGAKMGD